MTKLTTAIGAATLAGAAFLAGRGFAADPRPSFYRDAVYGYTIEPPRYDAVAPDESAGIAAFSEPVYGRIGATMQVTIEPTDAKFREHMRADFESLHYTLVAERALPLGGREGTLIEYTGTGPSAAPMHWLYLRVIDGARTFAITCASTDDGFAKLEPAFRASLASFRIEAAATAQPAPSEKPR
jgi:hypothetical protein